MIRLEIPGYGDWEIRNLLLDYNGTLAVGGYAAAGVCVFLLIYDNGGWSIAQAWNK